MIKRTEKNVKTLWGCELKFTSVKFLMFEQLCLIRKYKPAKTQQCTCTRTTEISLSLKSSQPLSARISVAVYDERPICNFGR
ncbi:hypothetical protein BpHYR1_041218 [Brachionus plicatilis]|uniref:Uncharacterized protein n=1 Tax=Brachionus plicatilis TaxID=10195 RepID=A0A3M7QNP9_BRAPC|nr:hypothetical protein BpHYR1_041218 [Brachionus plicatilis]